MALFPWLEGTIRYTDVRTRKYSQWEDFSGDQSYKDKSFDFKLRLWEEGYWLPQVAFGKRDIAGTYLIDDFASELDDERRGLLASRLKATQSQVFVGAISAEHVIDMSDENSKMFTVEKGKITD